MLNILNAKQEDNENILVTIYVFAYNQEAYVAAACMAAVKQDYSPLEIIFSDDCSKDRTYDIMKEIAASYQGPHTIKLNRNSKNLGLIDHVNLSFQIASGELIVAAAADDVSLSNRVSCIVKAYADSGKQALVIHTNANKIDENGNYLDEWIPPVVSEKMNLEDITNSSVLYIGATGAWNKKIYKIFGPLHYKNAHEDLVLGFRAALYNGLYYLDKALVNYRINIGLSYKYSSIPATVFKQLVNRYKCLKIEYDVNRQRQIDLKYINETVNHVENIRKSLEEKCSMFWLRKFIRLLVALVKLFYKKIF